MKKENSGYMYKEMDEMLIADDRNVNDKERKDDLKNSLYKIFKQLDEKQSSLKAINKQIRESVGIFGDEYESEDLQVIELVKNKDKLFDDIKDLKDVANTLIDAIGHQPQAIKTNFFISRYGDNSQKATDYISDKLSGENILSDARELIEGLGFANEVKSYSALNLYYAQYKILKVFGIECELS